MRISQSIGAEMETAMKRIPLAMQEQKMKKTLCVLLILLIASPCFGFGGRGIYAAPEIMKYTVATLPTSPPNGTYATVTDSLGGDCLTGGGTKIVSCYFNGSWIPLSERQSVPRSFSAATVTIPPLQAGAATLYGPDDTNLLLYSNTFSDAAWEQTKYEGGDFTLSDVGVDEGSGCDGNAAHCCPNATSKSWKVVWNDCGGAKACALTQTITWYRGHTFSVWIKNAGATNANIKIGGGSITNGSAFQVLRPGWQRISLTNTGTTEGTAAWIGTWGMPAAAYPMTTYMCDAAINPVPYAAKYVATTSAAAYKTDVVLPPQLITVPPNGLAKTPPMAYWDWYAMGKCADSCAKTTAANLKAAALAMVTRTNTSGLTMKDSGYQYVWVNLGWAASTRDANGNMQADSTRFPLGIKDLCDYIHGLGLKCGIYTSQSVVQNDGKPGMFGHAQQDMQTFASWGVDAVEVDWDTANSYYDVSAYPVDIYRAVFQHVSLAAQATGRPILLSGASIPASSADLKLSYIWARDAGFNLMRTHSDLTPASYAAFHYAMQEQADINFHQYAGPGYFNNLDPMDFGNGNMANSTESASFFAMYAVMGYPLLVSAPLFTDAGQGLTRISDTDFDEITNAGLISINQNALGAEAIPITATANTHVWAKRLNTWRNTSVSGSYDRWAIVLINGQATAQNVAVSWGGLGTYYSDVDYYIRNARTGESLGHSTSGYTATNVPSHGSVVIILSTTSSGG